MPERRMVGPAGPQGRPRPLRTFTTLPYAISLSGRSATKTMVDQEASHKSVVLEIAAEVAALLTPENRAFLAAKCGEFFRRVEDIEARCEEARKKCEWCTQKLGPRWEYKGLAVERQFVLRAPRIQRYSWTPVLSSDSRDVLGYHQTF